MRYTDLPRFINDPQGVPYLELTPRFPARVTYQLGGRAVVTTTRFFYRYVNAEYGPSGYDTTQSSEVFLAEIVGAFLAQGGRLSQLARCHRQLYKVWKTGRGRQRMLRRYQR